MFILCMILFTSFSFQSFSFGIEDIASMQCSNQYKSKFQLNLKKGLINATYLGRKDGLKLLDLNNGSQEHSKTSIQLKFDYFQNGLIALQAEVSDQKNHEGLLSVIFSPEQRFNVKQYENLSISLQRKSIDEFYVENMDCKLIFKENGDN